MLNLRKIKMEFRQKPVKKRRQKRRRFKNALFVIFCPECTDVVHTAPSGEVARLPQTTQNLQVSFHASAAQRVLGSNDQNFAVLLQSKQLFTAGVVALSTGAHRFHEFRMLAERTLQNPQTAV